MINISGSKEGYHGFSNVGRLLAHKNDLNIIYDNLYWITYNYFIKICKIMENTVMNSRTVKKNYCKIPDRKVTF